MMRPKAENFHTDRKKEVANNRLPYFECCYCPAALILRRNEEKIAAVGNANNLLCLLIDQYSHFL
jgi:hypothetical protein